MKTELIPALTKKRDQAVAAHEELKNAVNEAVAEISAVNFAMVLAKITALHLCVGELAALEQEALEAVGMADRCAANAFPKGRWL